MNDWIFSPKCPRFPDLSVFLGKLGSWLYNFLSWLGIRMRWVGRPLLALSRRRGKVDWARRTPADRLTAFSVTTMMLVIPLVLNAKLFRGLGVRPGPSLRAS